MEFSEALKHLRAGKHIKRTSWQDSAYVTCVKLPVLKYKGEDFMVEPCFVASVSGINNVWSPLVYDILAGDWEVEEIETLAKEDVAEDVKDPDDKEE